AAAMLGVRPAVARVNGGSVVAAPDLAGFGRLLARYLAFVTPIGAVAVIIAWWVGRNITRRAIAPLQDVTHALRRIAAGDFTPEPLLAGSSELHDLTTAYNEVAHRLTVATAERERNETRMRQFVADAGHELRTPLTIVMGYLDVLRNGVVSDPAGVARVHETMLAESRRMRTAIDKLILLARLERPAPPRREPVDVAALARRVAQQLAPLAGDRIAVTASQPEAYVDADEAELYEALKNVVENGVRYAPASRISIDISETGERIVVAVSDRGPGMEPFEVAHAFDRFYRGSPRHATEGSGLGLAIAKRAVERIGGTIALQSRPGEGTRVTLSLPG
ncbi:MAG: HAMP domain-containing sensor histidine kinase, partial [Candidatus Baltobacteraceae bacterium]